MKASMRIVAGLVLLAGALFASGCGYESTFTDHFVRFHEQETDKIDDLKDEWSRFKDNQYDRRVHRKEVYCDDCL